LSCAIEGPVPVPTILPEVVWRAGIDLNPLDVTQSEDMAWLEILVWPEHDSRRQRLRTAIQIARTDPPRLFSGDLNETVENLAGQAQSDATLVVFHSAVLAYMSTESRARFVATTKSLPGHWISNEGLPLAPVVSSTVLPPPPDPTKALFVLAKDGEAVAYAGPHGQSLLWFS
jgi:hypothetical protein